MRNLTVFIVSFPDHPSVIFMYEVHQQFFAHGQKPFKIVFEERRIVTYRQEMSAEQIVGILRSVLLPDFGEVVRWSTPAQPMIGSPVDVGSVQDAITKRRRDALLIEERSWEDVMIINRIFLSAINCEVTRASLT